MNTHFSDRLQNALIRSLERVKGRDGKFYEIFNRYGFFDVSDSKNGLTNEQRDQVPQENQNRFTDLSNAISEMIMFVMMDPEYGILVPEIQKIVDTLDVRGSTNAAQLNAIGNAFSSAGSIPVVGQYLVGIDSSRKLAEMQTAISMGTSAFNPDLIPPIAIGLDGIPVSVGNLYQPGFFQPNWSFLYSLEKVKNQHLYNTSNKLKWGANIDISIGGDKNDIYLKSVFGVTGTDEDLNPQGDVKGGISQETYSKLLLISKKDASILTSTDITDQEFKSIANSLTLNETQIQSSYYKYVNLRLWGPITNRKTWVYGHWGFLSNNSLPEYVKTAITSYIWTNGFTLEPEKNDVSAFISYCGMMGLYYQIGYQHPVRMYGISGVDKIINQDGNVISISSNGDIIANGLPKDESLSNIYYTWVADLISRQSMDSSGSTIGKQIRERRIAEANLIYKNLGKPVIDYGIAVALIPFEHTIEGLKNRKFDKLTAATIYRYPNEGSAGGSGENNVLLQPDNNSGTVNFDPGIDSSIISNDTIMYLKSLMSKSGVTQLTITSTFRSPEKQVKTMFNNLNNGNLIKYGTAGTSVNDVYYDEKKKLGYTELQKIDSVTDTTTITNAMLAKLNEVGPENISKHSADFNVLNVIDISPTRMFPNDRIAHFRQVCLEEKSLGNIRNVLCPSNIGGPGNDPAIHLEIWQASTGKGALPVGEGVNDRLPEVAFTLNIPTYRKENAWMAPLAKDHVYVTTEVNDG